MRHSSNIGETHLQVINLVLGKVNSHLFCGSREQAYVSMLKIEMCVASRVHESRTIEN